MVDENEVPSVSDYGDKMLAFVDPKGTIIGAALAADIRQYKGPDAISQLLKADLGDAINPDLVKAYEVCDALKVGGFAPERVTLVMRFHTMAQLMANIDDLRAMSRDKELLKKERLDALKACQEAVSELNKVINVLQKLIIKFELRDRRRVKSPLVPQPAAKPRVGQAPELA